MKILLISSSKEWTFLIFKLQWGFIVTLILINPSDHHALSRERSGKHICAPDNLLPAYGSNVLVPSRWFRMQFSVSWPWWPQVKFSQCLMFSLHWECSPVLSLSKLKSEIHGSCRHKNLQMMTFWKNNNNNNNFQIINLFCEWLCWKHILTMMRVTLESTEWMSLQLSFPKWLSEFPNLLLVGTLV